MKTSAFAFLALAALIFALGCVSEDVPIAEGAQNADAPPQQGQPATAEADGQEAAGWEESVSKAEEAAPEAMPQYAVVDTNQEKCYDDMREIACPEPGDAFYGQDAQYGGAAPAYRDNGDGTVTDLNTGLMWEKDPGGKKTYQEAVGGASSAGTGGYTDWRVPTIKELYSLMDFRGTDPSGPTSSSAVPFIDDDYFAFQYGDTSTGDRVIDSQWVTDTVYRSAVMDGQQCFFGVNFADGRIKCYPAGQVGPGGFQKGYFVIYVRGPAYGGNAFTENGDGTITDNATGLMWTKNDSGAGMVWKDALAYCEGLDLAGHGDWRLPDAKELQGIVDYDRSPDTTGSPAIDPAFTCTEITNEAGQKDYGFYWTGTTHVKNNGMGDSAAYVSFGRAMGYFNNEWVDVHGAGAQRSDPKAGNPADYPNSFGPQGDARRLLNYVRCVRDA